MDECSSGVADCGSGTCIEDEGGFSCSCPSGFEETGTWPDVTCSDIDECDGSAAIVAACGTNGSCQNLAEGEFTCNCAIGFEHVGSYPHITCKDINDCATAVCGHNGVCHNNDGAYSCSCDVGFEQAGAYPNISCVDIDESNESSSIVADCGDNGTAVNLVGGFTCNCVSGYESVGAYLSDIVVTR